MSTSTEKLFELINTDGETPFEITPAMVAISPVEVVSVSGKNTKVILTAEEGSGLAGTRDIFYNRVNLSATGNGLVIESLVDFTPEIILGYFNTERNASFLNAEDLQTLSIPPLTVTSLPTDITLTASSSSYGWIGNTTVTLKRNGTQEELASGLGDYVLDVMTQPNFW